MRNDTLSASSSSLPEIERAEFLYIGAFAGIFKEYCVPSSSLGTSDRIDNLCLVGLSDSLLPGLSISCTERSRGSNINDIEGGLDFLW